MCIQDYHWWWRSFLTSGFTAVYLFIYAVHYFFSKLQIIGAASTFLYFGYTMIMVLIFFLFTGEALLCDVSSLSSHRAYCINALIAYYECFFVLLRSYKLQIMIDILLSNHIFMTIMSFNRLLYVRDR